MGLNDLATFSHQHIVQYRLFGNRPGQIPGPCINRTHWIIESERGIRTRKSQIGFIKGSNRSNVFPVIIKIECINGMMIQRMWDHFTAEIMMRPVLKNRLKDFPVEQINSHGPDVRPLRVFRTGHKVLQYFWIFGFLGKGDDTSVRVSLEQSKPGGLITRHWLDSYGDSGS